MRPTELSNQCDVNGYSVESGTKSTRMVFPPAWPGWDLACVDAIRALQQCSPPPPARPRDLGHQPDIAHRYQATETTAGFLFLAGAAYNAPTTAPRSRMTVP